MKETVTTTRVHNPITKSVAHDFNMSVYKVMMDYNQYEGSIVPIHRDYYNAGCNYDVKQLITFLLEDMEKNGVIKRSWEVLSDHRNNSAEDIATDVCRIKASYTEVNCQGQTTFEFVVQSH